MHNLQDVTVTPFASGGARTLGAEPAARRSNRMPVACKLPANDSRRTEYWWEPLVKDDDVLINLVREIEVDKGKLDTHERVCAERYLAIEKRFTSFEKTLNEAVQALNSTGSNTNRRIIAALIAALGVLGTAVAWEAGQLYQLEPLRVAAHQAK